MAAVEKAYRAALLAFDEAGAIPDPDYPGLAATHVDPVLTTSRNTLRAYRIDGKVARYPSPSQSRVVVDLIEIDGAVARLHFCAVDDSQVVRAGEDGSRPSRPITVEGSAALRRVSGRWKLAEQRFDKRLEGVTGCAES